MDDIAIRVEGLGKRFRLRHAGGRTRYRTLREDLLGLPRRLLAGLSGRRDEREEFWALKDVSFEVKRGEVLGIIGRNGAGKSTLLKVLSRIMDPTCGEATVQGRIGSLLEVGTGFHPELTGRENIYLSGALLGMRRDEVRRRFDEIVAFAGVEKFLDTPCKHYSSGMYARLGFAVAAHLDAEILLVDEVLAVGDTEFQRKCLGKMAEVAGGGRTVLFVSHNMSAVAQLCSRALVLERGTVTFGGNVRNAIDAYLQASNTGSTIIKISEGDHHSSFSGARNIQLQVAEIIGAPCDQFAVYWKSLIHLRFRVSVKERMINVIFGFSLSTQEGTSLLSCHRYDGPNLDKGAVLEPGVLAIDLELMNPLRPGRYMIAFGAHNAVSRDILFLVPEVGCLEVLEVSASGEAGPTAHKAYVNTEARWQLRPYRDPIGSSDGL